MIQDGRLVRDILDEASRYDGVPFDQLHVKDQFELMILQNVLTWRDQRDWIFGKVHEAFFTNVFLRGMFVLCRQFHAKNRLDHGSLYEHIRNGVLGRDAYQTVQNWPENTVKFYHLLNADIPRRLLPESVGDWCNRRASEIRKKAMEKNCQMFGIERAQKMDAELLANFTKEESKSDFPVEMDEIYEKFVADFIFRQESGTPFWKCYQTFGPTIEGFRPDDMSVIAARPGHGKTMFAISTSIHLVQNNDDLKVCLVNMEMPPSQIIPRFIQSFMRKTKEEVSQLKYNQLAHFKRKIFGGDRLFTTPVLHKPIEDILEYLQPLVERGYRVFFFDYIQLMKTREKYPTEHQRLNRAIEILKEWKDANPGIHVCCLAQLKRAQGKRTPDMDDLRKTSDIEEAAAWIALIHNPEPEDGEKIHKRTVPMGKDKDGVLKFKEWQQFQIIFGKNRHGAKGRVRLEVCLETQEVEDIPTKADPDQKVWGPRAI